MPLYFSNPNELNEKDEQRTDVILFDRDFILKMMPKKGWTIQGEMKGRNQTKSQTKIDREHIDLT